MYRIVGKFPWDRKTKAYSKVIKDKDEAIYIREAFKKIVGRKSHFRIIPDSEVKLRNDIEDKWYEKTYNKGNADLILRMKNCRREIKSTFHPEIGVPSNIKRGKRHCIEQFLRQENIRELVEDCADDDEEAIIISEYKGL